MKFGRGVRKIKKLNNYNFLYDASKRLEQTIGLILRV